MDWLLVLFKVVPSLVALAEEIFGSSTGEVKKSTVQNAAQAVVAGLEQVSTGGQKETWEKLAPVVDTVIEATVATANNFGWAKVVDDNFESMKSGL